MSFMRYVFFFTYAIECFAYECFVFVCFVFVCFVCFVEIS